MKEEKKERAAFRLRVHGSHDFPQLQEFEIKGSHPNIHETRTFAVPHAVRFLQGFPGSAGRPMKRSIPWLPVGLGAWLI